MLDDNVSKVDGNVSTAYDMEVRYLVTKVWYDIKKAFDFC